MVVARDCPSYHSAVDVEKLPRLRVPYNILGGGDDLIINVWRPT